MLNYQRVLAPRVVTVAYILTLADPVVSFGHSPPEFPGISRQLTINNNH